MTLEARIIALAQAVGADIKTLRDLLAQQLDAPMITVGDTPPPDPKINDIWIDISGI